MEILTKQYLIIAVFAREPWKKFTFKQVKKLSQNKSDNYVHTTLKKLVKNKILKEEKIGNVIAYSICNNVHALNTLGYISEYLAHSANHLPYKNIKKVLGKIKNVFYTFLVTGSYASNKQKKTSDLDVVIICDDTADPNKILSQIKLECETMIPSVHPYVFRKTQFYEMLVNKEENYGKETARKNFIITGAKQYYHILMEAINHGFNG